MATEAKSTNYWISSTALYIQLNAMGEPDYVQCSVVSGASVLCYMSDVPGLGYDAGHNYQRWPLVAYPSIFPDSEKKYIYAAIPRVRTGDNDIATVVFPSQRIDIYGKAINEQTKEGGSKELVTGAQIGNENFYYIYLQGIISEVKTDADGQTRIREWEQHVDCGSLATDEALASGGEGSWWKFNSVSDTISFLKTILQANFEELTAKDAKIIKLGLNGKDLTDVADETTLENSNTTVVTPQYLGQFGVKHFLAKDKDDIAKGTITFEKVQRFLKGLLVGDSNSENGGSWITDAEGRSHLITDYLEVRMKAIFETLEILHTDTSGGELFITPVGSNRILKVEEVNITYDGVSQKAYRCYFLGEQDGSKVENKWKVGDQARSKSFNLTQGKYHNVGNHYYWRLVIGVSTETVEIDGKKYHYVDLSDIDKDAASDEPMVDDILNQCGNRTDNARQSCLVFSAVDTYSPSVTLYHGVNGYTFNNKEYVDYGVNHSTGKAFFHVYGDMYFGDRPTSANNYEGSSYVKYDSDKKKVTIKGDLDIKSTYDGKTLDKYIADNSLDKNAVETIIKKSKTITDLQNQIDGAIETWFYDGVPTLKNEPAVGWTDKEIHLGDLYYDNLTGKAYRFAKDGSTYKWIIITDTELTKAIEDSSQALKDAKSKRRIFGSQPVPPYDVNDMWVNATYPSDGSTYKNEILKCSTSKAEGEEFDISDWELASKYTDDTKAEEAKKAAENAQAEIKDTQTNLIALGTTVSNNKKAFDAFTSDGYLDSSEIAAIAQDSKRLEDDYNAAVESYNNVVGSKFLLDKDGNETTYKTDLVSAKATLDSAKNGLIHFLFDIVRRYNDSDSDEKAAIKVAAAQKYTNFTNAYKAFYDKLGVANNYITSNLFDGLNTKLITNMAGLEYIKAALVDGRKTEIKGGLVLTTLIALRNEKGDVTSGINGADTKENGIALWLGGKAIDRQASTTKEDEMDSAAKALLRFDGTGYFANGNLWWDADGTLHADPTSFIINKNNVGVQLALFAPVWKSGTTDTTKLANVLAIDPQKPFTHLDVSGNITTEGSLKIGGVYLSWDSDNNALRLSKDAAGKEAANFYALGGITAYGAGSSTTGGGGGLNGSVKRYSDALKLTSESLSEIASAYSIKALDSRITSLEGGSAMDVSVSGSGNAVTAISKSGTTISVTKGTTFLTSHQSLASYLTKTDAASLYQPKGNYLTAHQSLDGYVNAIAVSGSGNAVTAVTKSGKTITFTKGATYLTSHQSLAAYATQNWVKNEATAHNADMVDNYHASGLFTGFSISDVANKVTISIGGTSKALNLVRAFPNGVGNNFNDIATHGNSMGMSDIAAPYASSTANHQTLNGYVNPNGQTGWHHYINLSYTDSNNTATSPNMWQTQFAIKAGTTEVYVRSRAGGKISNGAAWAAPWVRLARVTDNVASASKVANALSWSGYSSGSYNGSAAKSISIPNNTNQLTNGAGFITSSASISGNAATATNADKLDGFHANGLLTAISNSDKGISITVGKTTKSVSNISVNYASSAGNADTVDGYHVNVDNAHHGYIPRVAADGVMKVGKYIDFHNDNSGKYDFSTRLQTSGNYGNSVNLPSNNGTLALTSDNVASATKLQTARTIWGQAFDGTGNVDGELVVNGGSVVCGIKINSSINEASISFNGTNGYRWVTGRYSDRYFVWNSNNGERFSITNAGNVGIGDTNPGYKLCVSGDIYATNTIRSNGQNQAIMLSNNSNPAWISALGGQVIFNTGKAIRFGETAWDWNQWAGLKYNHSKKTIYLGIADGSVFNANSAQSGGTLSLQNIHQINMMYDAIDDIYCVFVKFNNYNKITLFDSDWNVGINSAELDINCSTYITDGSFTIVRGETNGYKYGLNLDDTTITCNFGYNAPNNNINMMNQGSNISINSYGDIYLNAYMGGIHLNKNTNVEGNLLATGGVTAYQSSDIRLKQDLRKLDYLGIIKAMGGTFGFAWKKDNTRSIGWIAQHVLRNPHLKDIVETDENGYYKINYWSPKLIATAFGAIEQVDDEVTRLKKKVKTLENRVKELEIK